MNSSGPGRRRFQGAEILEPTECKNWKGLGDPLSVPFTEEKNGGPERVSNYFRSKRVIKRGLEPRCSTL